MAEACSSSSIKNYLGAPLRLFKGSQELAIDDEARALREHLAGHRHGTDLTESGLHGRKPGPRPSRMQVHFLNYRSLAAQRMMSTGETTNVEAI
jgi:hypothetical protein